VDAAITGEPDGSAQIVEVTSAGVLRHDIRFADGRWQSQGWGTPAGAIGITQVSIVAWGGSTQIAAVKSDGSAEFTFRTGTGSWSGWEQASIQPARSLSDISVGFVPNEYSLMFGVTSG
jgi:hypothetical protein